MSASVRRVAVTLLALFGALFVNLNYLQVIRAESLAEDTRNTRRIIAEYDVRRGSIIAADGQTELARVEDTGGRLRFQRIYDHGELFAHVTGHHSFVYGRTQVEQAYNEFLAGGAPEAFARNMTDLLAGRERTGEDVVTTVRPSVQAAARDALGGQHGAVIALEPSTGAVLAMWSNPTYDPNGMAGHEGPAVRAYAEALRADESEPLRNRAMQQRYNPGSTFKIVTAAAALAAGRSPEATFPDPVRQPLPQTTATIGNFGGGPCAGGGSITFRQAMVVSCNTTFAQLGLEVGAEGLVAQAERFGLNTELDLPLPTVPSVLPEEGLDPPATAQSAIGQRDVQVTPLQMAMITAAIGNGGVLMTPRIVDRVEEFGTGEVVRQFPPEPLVLPGRPDAQAVRPEHAAALRDMMEGVVAQGTGRAAAIPGVSVAGKTGTAQAAGPPTVWFVGLAPANNPQVAVAVVVERGGAVGTGATGGGVAAPIARAVMQAALGDEPTVPATPQPSAPEG
ncbi:MAG TPA: penicillin-binding protein 2 [Egibacteraceae bacterium]|nr:penicillin-binding protein 2 [Egibacteraceae bacterium]